MPSGPSGPASAGEAVPEAAFNLGLRDADMTTLLGRTYQTVNRQLVEMVTSHRRTSDRVFPTETHSPRPGSGVDEE